MTYQTIYSSESTMPMQPDDLEELLEQARRSNGIEGISGALLYSGGVFLQILEGERGKVEALMARIRRDVRHEKVTVLREGDIAAARFTSWKMAYVAATSEQVARWAGLDVGTGSDDGVDVANENLERTARFAQDILALLTPDQTDKTASQDVKAPPAPD